MTTLLTVKLVDKKDYQDLIDNLPSGTFIIIEEGDRILMKEEDYLELSKGILFDYVHKVNVVMKGYPI